MKEQNCKPGNSSFLEQFLRAIRSAISQAVVLILPQQNLTHILYVVPFFQSIGGRKGEREGGSRKKKLYVNVAVVQPLSCVQLSLWPNELQHTRLSCPLVLLKLMFIESGMPYNHIILCPPPFSSCPQSFTASGSFPMSQLFKVGSQILKFQLQHQSFQCIFRVDFI